MSKLPEKYQFTDLSDYGRPIGRWIAQSLVSTRFTPIDVTTSFIVAGVFAIYCVFTELYVAAAFLIIIKSILDAADGELSRLKNTPSYTGRYYDSIADLLLNALLIYSICYVTKGSYSFAAIAFVALQLQGTVYNYYYVILRNRVAGDTTSRIFENQTPVALAGESQRNVDIFYALYVVLYRGFDKVIYFLDKQAMHSSAFPKWFMTMISIFGLGFQLLVIAFMLVLGKADLIISVIVASSALILFFIGMRKFVLK
jgi:phosphatidylglycerophosphate synthase